MCGVGGEGGCWRKKNIMHIQFFRPHSHIQIVESINVRVCVCICVLVRGVFEIRDSNINTKTMLIADLLCSNMRPRAIAPQINVCVYVSVKLRIPIVKLSE